MKFNIENLFEFKQLIRQLSAGLKRISFGDNFEGIEITIDIAAGAELRIRNPLKYIPSSYIITNKTGNSTISRSNTWTSDYVYFTNYGAGDTTASIFLKR